MGLVLLHGTRKEKNLIEALPVAADGLRTHWLSTQDYALLQDSAPYGTVRSPPACKVEVRVHIEMVDAFNIHLRRKHAMIKLSILLITLITIAACHAGIGIG